MSKTLNGSTFGEKMYNTLPQKYRNDDSMVEYALKRYLQALSDGGFSKVIEESNGILDLNDPSKTPSEVLSILFEQYGLKIFNGVPELYLRKLLPILGDLYARKGATTVIEYLTSIISDVKADVSVSPNFSEDYHIDLRLEMDYDRQGERDIPDKDQLYRILKDFLPFFIETTVIFVYLFYETAKLQAKDELVVFHTKDVRNEDARVIRQKGEGLFPSIGNTDLLLNKSIYLNETYYYDVDVDQFIDVVTHTIKETGKMNRTKSTYYRETLNSPVKLLNNDVVLNEYMDTDELVSTDIHMSPVKVTGDLRAEESLIYKVHLAQVSESATAYSTGITSAHNSRFFIGAVFGSAVFGNDEFDFTTDEFSDKITFIQSDSGGFDRTTTLQMGITNNEKVLTNMGLYTNHYVDVDYHEDRIGFAGEEQELNSHEAVIGTYTIGAFRYLATLNTSATLNVGLLTNENLSDIGNLLIDDSVVDTITVAGNKTVVYN